MENPNPENWNEVRYRELNTYFRIKIEQILRTDLQLKDQLNQSGNMQLKDLVAHMHPDDQERWEEFLVLDRQKLEIDMWNHLHGNGTRYEPGTGFTSPADTDW